MCRTRCNFNPNCPKDFNGKNCLDTQKNTGEQCKKGETVSSLAIKRKAEKKQKKKKN